MEENRLDDLLAELKEENEDDEIDERIFSQDEVEKYKRNVIKAGDIIFGAMMISKENFEDYYEQIDEKQFITVRQKILFRTFVLLENENTEVNLKNVIKFLDDNKILGLISKKWISNIVSEAIKYKEEQELANGEDYYENEDDEYDENNFDDLPIEDEEFEKDYEMDLDGCLEILDNYFQLYDLINGLKPIEDDEGDEPAEDE